MAAMTKTSRSKLVTFLGAGIAALLAEHYLKPNLKGMLKI